MGYQHLHSPTFATSFNTNALSYLIPDRTDGVTNVSMSGLVQPRPIWSADVSPNALPGPVLYSCGNATMCETFWAGCSTCGSSLFNTAAYSPWGVAEARAYCTSHSPTHVFKPAPCAFCCANVSFWKGNAISTFAVPFNSDFYSPWGQAQARQFCEGATGSGAIVNEGSQSCPIRNSSRIINDEPAIPQIPFELWVSVSAEDPALQGAHLIK